ncbi:MAG TPA: tRNA (adenosine(37)-N6)-threonylcarbamoyltransferase complex dimerization subunit type 1 TsaB [Candidatus Sulfotelmatobacter sp.]|nr:tRNA (adenosine(37)-N6)-threonylcarbamoyltransferase complex dimerization subunit type 1 TsaB [Candidatus Sulfotelmatobacter sp.]
MNILTIKTDNPEAEISLIKDGQEIEKIKWQAHKELSKTILVKITDLLKKSDMEIKDLGGLIIFAGPGSFTGLRIGFSVANTLAYSLSIPLVSTGTHDWVNLGLKRLENNENDYVAVPNYGREPHITTPRK